MPTIEERALALVNEVAGFGYLVAGDFMDDDQDCLLKALCRALEAHDATLAEFEAFKREVSDEIERCSLGDFAKERLSRFILPKPVEPLVAVMAFNSLDTATAEQRAANLREDAKALGYEIKLVEVGDAD